MERVLQRLDGMEEAIHRTRAESSSRPARPPAPVVPLAALLPHDPEGSLVRPGRPLPAGAGFVGAGGGDPWAPFVPPRPAPPPRDYAVSSRRARASSGLPAMKEVPTATLAHLWLLAECLQGLEVVLVESHGSMSVTPPSMFSQMPRARCHAAASAIFSYVSPLQAAPLPGVVSATQLAEKALDLKTLVGDRGTPVDVVGATASVVRLMWLTTREMLAEVRFRSYLPRDDQLMERKLPPAQLPKFQEPTPAQPLLLDPNEDPVTAIAPRKPNWDLRRDVAKRLAKLERRTQRAMIELMREEEERRQQQESGIEGS
ncbi:unnamed protein product [Closterium sp. Yama58-4]|nr:unnamed protein product [Closterium sp. Yama58-4]